MPTPIVNPPKRRTVPFDDNVLPIDGRVRPAPAPTPQPSPAPDDGRKQRRRYEREVGDVVPPARPVSPPVRRAPDISVPRPTPVAPTPRITPRYRGPEAGNPTRPGLAPVERRTPATTPGRPSRNEAPWTYGRSNRSFQGSDPWGTNAAGRRNYGTWRPIYNCSPYQFWWGSVPSWCRWGYYSWPAYYGVYWPRYYDAYSWQFGWSTDYWSCWSPYAASRQHLWYWPSNIYAPTPIVNNYYDTDDDVSHVTIHIDGGAEVTSSDAESVHISVGGVSSSATKALPSKATLAERHVTLADNYFREGRYQDAADNYLRAIGFLPEDASLHFALADALFALGEYHYAAFMIGKGLELDPTLAEVEADKRAFYGDAKAFATQLETLVRYTAEKPYDAAAHLLLGYNLKFSADPAGAERAFRRVLEIDKHSVPAELFLAAATKKSAKPAEAPAAPPREPAAPPPAGKTAGDAK